jgi:flagellar hook assembly protein FlgD
VANPFAPGGTIRVTTREAAPARLLLPDVAGRLVRVLAAGDWAAGEHAIAWDGRPGSGAAAPRGVYFLRVESGGRSDAARLLLID